MLYRLHFVLSRGVVQRFFGFFREYGKEAPQWKSPGIYVNIHGGAVGNPPVVKLQRWKPGVSELCFELFGKRVRCRKTGREQHVFPPSSRMKEIFHSGLDVAEYFSDTNDLVSLIDFRFQLKNVYLWDVDSRMSWLIEKLWSSMTEEQQERVLTKYPYNGKKCTKSI